MIDYLIATNLSMKQTNEASRQKVCHAFFITWGSMVAPTSLAHAPAAESATAFCGTT